MKRGIPLIAKNAMNGAPGCFLARGVRTVHIFLGAMAVTSAAKA